MMQEIFSYLSDVAVKFSLINVLFSEINQMMSTSPVPVQSRLLLLPRVQIILSELNQFVMSTQKCKDVDEVTSDVDDCPHDLGVELEWDNNNYQDSYYHLYYSHEDEEKDDTSTAEEEKVLSICLLCRCTQEHMKRSSSSKQE